MLNKCSGCPGKKRIPAFHRPLFKTIATFCPFPYLYVKRMLMKRIILAAAALLVIRAAGTAQAYEDKIQYDKKKQEAIAMQYNFSPEAVENAIVSKFSKMGYKPKEEKGIFNPDKGFIQFKNASISVISRDKMDYIVNVERKSRKEKDEAVLYLIMYKKDDNAIPQMDAGEIRNAKAFLEALVPDVEAADLELQIKAQEDALARIAKKLGDLKDDQATLEKKLSDNKAAQIATRKDSVAQRQTLDTLISRRKKS